MIEFLDNKLKITKLGDKELSKEYFSSQLTSTIRENYFKPESYMTNDYIKLVYNRTLRRLSEINHTAVVKMLTKKCRFSLW